MSEGKRPGGLTALAVLNFIFGGFGALALLGLVAVFVIVSSGEGNDDPAMEEMVNTFKENQSMLLLLIGLSVIATILQIVSGIGYLKQKKFLGRTLGTAFALVSIGSNVASAAMTDGQPGGGFGIGFIVGIVYPVLTLILLNTTFKYDFHD